MKSTIYLMFFLKVPITISGFIHFFISLTVILVLMPVLNPAAPVWSSGIIAQVLFQKGTRAPTVRAISLE